MGAFYLCKLGFKVPDRVIEVFRQKGFADPQVYNLEAYKLLAFPKIGIDIQSFYCRNDCSMLVIGSCFYRGDTYQENLNNIFEDYLSGDLSFDTLSGTFIILFKSPEGFSYVTDRAGSQNVFIDETQSLASSSFLAILASGSNRQINRDACREVILTGNLIGPDTIFNNIVRYERTLTDCILMFENLDPFCYDTKSKISDYNGALSLQIESLDNLLRPLQSMMDELGIVTGLTGGLDSRLLYFLVSEHTANYSVHSTFRKTITREIAIAKELTSARNDDLFSPSFTYPIDSVSEDLQSSFKQNMYFNDGMIRAHQFWIEEIKSLKYLKNLYRDCYLGFSGVGGEQYRNSEYLSASLIDLDAWVKNILLGKAYKSQVKSRVAEEPLQYMKDKICGLLDLKRESQSLSYMGIKRYYNEIWNPSTRTIRNNIENQYRLFFSPFTDSSVAQAAYMAVDHVQAGFQIELDLINTIQPALSMIKTDYGFAPAEKPGLNYKAQFILKNLLGLSLWATFRALRKRPQRSEFSLLIMKHTFLASYVDNVDQLNLIADTNALLEDNTLYHMVIELGMLLEEFHDCIRFD